MTATVQLVSMMQLRGLIQEAIQIIFELVIKIVEIFHHSCKGNNSIFGISAIEQIQGAAKKYNKASECHVSGHRSVEFINACEK